MQGVKAGSGTYSAPVVVDAAGPFSKTVCETAGVHIPVTPDSHEAAITEPVKSFFTTMVVDLRPGPDSKNYYFYQNSLGQIVFCITPEPLIVGKRQERDLGFPAPGGSQNGEAPSEAQESESEANVAGSLSHDA